VSAVEQLCPRTGKEKNNYAHVEEKKWTLCPRRRKEMNDYAHVDQNKWNKVELSRVITDKYDHSLLRGVFHFVFVCFLFVVY
jgi:hypothetical protein